MSVSKTLSNLICALLIASNFEADCKKHLQYQTIILELAHTYVRTLSKENTII